MDALTIHQLQCFDAVVSEGGFQAGATKLHRSHSAVITAIRNLESQLGLKLLDRKGYRVTLSNAGRSFHRRTRVFLHELSVTEPRDPIGNGRGDRNAYRHRRCLPAHRNPDAAAPILRGPSCDEA